MTSFAHATGHARLAARHNPAAANGRSREQIAAGRVIQVGFGKRGTFRMTAEDARDFAVGLMEMASLMLPHQMLVVKWQPPGAKYHRHKRVRAGEVLPFAAAVMRACRACRAAEANTLVAGV